MESFGRPSSRQRLDGGRFRYGDRRRERHGRSRSRARTLLPVLPLVVLLTAATAGCAAAGRNDPPPNGPPGGGDPTPCASRTDTPSPRPSPVRTRLAWRAEETEDGALRMTVGDVDKAPRDPDAVQVTSYRAPASEETCDSDRTVKVKGWWCSTTVKPVEVDGEIVVGGADPRARITGGGFATRCSDRPGRMRQAYRVERDSWSGWRGYGDFAYSPWSKAQRQHHGEVAVACPQGRVGTYNYRLAVRTEIDGVEVGDSRAASATVRADCGTGSQ